MDAALPELTLLEARILGVLVEKEKTTPDVYPLTVNSLTAGCNQKSSRDPVMSVSEREVQSTLEALRERGLVLETYGASGRVLRYEQNFRKSYALPTPSVALLAVLMLRGPQTVSELRAHCERLHHFEDTSSVEAYLDELAIRTAGPLTAKLPKQPGSREHRWMHLLCGQSGLPTEQDRTREEGGRDNQALEARMTELEREVAELRAMIQGFADKNR